jgi:hypothetical protein
VPNEWIAITALALTMIGGLVGGALAAGRAAQKLQDVANDIKEIKRWTYEKGDMITRNQERIRNLENDPTNPGKWPILDPRRSQG